MVIFILTETDIFTNFTGSIALFRGYDTNVWPTSIYSITCSGEETSLWDCSYSIFDNGVACGYDASVICQGIIHFCRAMSYILINAHESLATALANVFFWNTNFCLKHVTMLVPSLPMTCI